jgi:hypothetical protein
MNKVEIQLNTKHLQFFLASGWEEIEDKQWVSIYQNLESGNVFNHSMIRALILKGKFPQKYMDQMPKEGFLPLYDCIDFLIKTPCSSPPFPYLKIKRKKYHLPSARLENISIIEFAFLDMAWELNRFFRERNQEAKAEEWLTRLCMYMARPIDKRINPNDTETYNGDRREKFNTAVIEPRWPVFQKIDSVYRAGCIFFFLGCKAYIHQKYKGSLWFDTHDKDGNEIIGVQKDDKPQPFRWIEICRKLAGGKFGNLKETQFAGLYDVLEELKDQRKK